MLSIAVPNGERTIVRTPPAREAVVSWNTRFPEGSIDLIVHRGDGIVSSPLPYVAFSARERRSLNGRDETARIEVDVVRAATEIHAIEVRTTVPLDFLAVSTPPEKNDTRSASNDPSRQALLLDVPFVSQYLPDHPERTAWCSPAALSMLLAYWGFTLPLPEVAESVFDTHYAGTGNWAFNVAFAGTLGLRGAVAHLRDLAHAERFIEAEIPLALSFAWKSDELPGAPIEHSNGHLAVLRGFTERGDPILNDPAQSVRHEISYNRDAFERAWCSHGGIAYLVAPSQRTDDLVRLTNFA